MTTIIHVNINVIRHNKKHGNRLPACRIQNEFGTKYAKEVIINGPSRLVYSPDKPLRCGARLWIETDAEIKLIEETEYSEIKEIMENL